MVGRSCDWLIKHISFFGIAFGHVTNDDPLTGSAYQILEAVKLFAMIGSGKTNDCLIECFAELSDSRADAKCLSRRQ